MYMMRSDKVNQTRNQLGTPISDTGARIQLTTPPVVMDESTYVPYYTSADLKNYQFSKGTYLYTKVVSGKRRFWVAVSETDLGENSPTLNNADTWMDVTEMIRGTI